jgi:cytosine/adenosine deaminase-related metal-dependent hydrolase
MSPAQSLLSGTREAARLLGVEKETGTLEAGKAADIVAVAGNVLADIRATEHPVLVMRLGKIVVHKTAAGEDVPEPRARATAATAVESRADAPAAAFGEFY